MGKVVCELLPKTCPGLKVRAWAKAGHASVVKVKVGKLNIAFDMGACFDWTTSATHVFISHCHLDHFNAVFHHARLRSMQGHKKLCKYYVPRGTLPFILDAKKAFEALDSTNKEEFRMEILEVPLNSSEKIKIDNEHFCTVFETVHRVPSVGYCVWRGLKKGKEEYKGLSGEEKKELAMQGTSLTEQIFEPFICYTGDTKIEGIFKNPICFQAKLLITELTFLDGKVDKAETSGHVHLDQLSSDFFLNFKPAKEDEERTVLFVHFSGKYSAGAIQSLCQKKLLPLLPKESNCKNMNIALALEAFGFGESFPFIERSNSDDEKIQLNDCV